MTDGFRLVMTQGPQPGQTFSLDKELISIGRDPGNDITINDPQISRQHARLALRGGIMVLEDLGSTNGTFVNGMRLTAPHTLANGDVIGLGGGVTLTFYGQATGAAETVIAPQGIVPPRPAVSTPEPGFPLPQAYTPPAPEAPPAPAKKKRTGLWIGCGCGTLLILALLVAALFYMDAYYPHILYTPLRWLGF
ncbi:MAG TPA: FHA domain-containing protein [Anaerolineae bacterium]|nr:FHA domain-containing protein [Anaerolineae bacterium]